MPNRALWMATANNLLASEEIRRRILVCRLNARMERPGERTDFKHPNLLAYVREHRPALVWSCLTLVANWIAEGRPPSGIKMGSYESWVGVIGGILECAGISGLLDNRAEFNERAADDAATLDGIVEEWHATFGRDTLVSIQQLVALDAAEEVAPSDGKSRERVLGWALKPAHEKVVAGHMIMKTQRDGRARYYLASPDGHTAIRKRRKGGSSRRVK